ncbi:DUF3043 domain-containing protein [Gordonia insulae]|uniref:DUF3043 domain-containing protein n=1 Tax=Gordonia insulae TaxID=2420509 RepID=A0A3G8JGK2_9ACTN|nr:DUF3043 domain-containing protein [Gordonia insulae]AZG43652.1 hypothetical protein D7316_00221 [Gordonia insulae]
MKLPWKSDDDAAAAGTDTDVSTTADDDASTSTNSDSRGPSATPGKGRPTPSRREAERRRRGPVAPPPTTRAEARARKKELKSTLSKEDKRRASDERRTQRTEQREKMMAGDERYLMPRDKGPAKRFTRDLVDSRRNFAGLFMPFAIVLIVVMFVPQLAVYANFVLLVFVLFMAIDAFVLGRLVNRRVRERYPDVDPSQTGFRLGWYAFTRAMQLRMMRAPKPQVSPGDEV